MKKLLVVDDSKFIFEEIKLMLKDSQYEVVGYAESGERAIEEYERVEPDVVAMDIILPGMDGLETTRELLARWPEAKVLMVSSLAYHDTIEQAERSGAKSFLYKPFDEVKLISALDQICV